MQGDLKFWKSKRLEIIMITVRDTEINVYKAFQKNYKVKNE